MYVDEKKLIDLANQVNLAFKAQELAMEELKKDLKDLTNKVNAKKSK
tara:strand:- start:374 stop:514 length:141 start_codon:yes stop_codon:yes gene_type:complete